MKTWRSRLSEYKGSWGGCASNGRGTDGPAELPARIACLISLAFTEALMLLVGKGHLAGLRWMCGQSWAPSTCFLKEQPLGTENRVGHKVMVLWAQFESQWHTHVHTCALFCSEVHAFIHPRSTPTHHSPSKYTPTNKKPKSSHWLIPAALLSLSPPLFPSSFPFDYTGLRAALETHQGHSCHRAFAQSVPVPGMLPLWSCTAHSFTSFKALLKCPLVNDAFPWPSPSPSPCSVFISP